MAASPFQSPKLSSSSPLRVEKERSSSSSNLLSPFTSHRSNILRLLNSSLLLKATLQYAEGRDDFVENFYSLLSSVALQKEGIQAIALSEIRDTDEETLLFRRDSACTRLFRLYNAHFGHEYLHRIVGTFIGLLQRKYFNKLDLNLCQSLEAEQEDRERAVRETQEVFGHLLALLLGTALHVPTEILEISQSISQTVSDKFGEKSGDTFLCGYFFLRFLCPSLATPSLLLHLDISQNVEKFCVLLSRILQASVNNQEFENENMAFANHMVCSSQQQIRTFFAGLRKGSFEGDEVFANAALSVHKVMKKYRHKCPKKECDSHSLITKEESFRYFADFFRVNNFSIRMKIKFESGYPRGESPPVVVTTALSNLKVLRNFFQTIETSSSSSPLSSTTSSSSPPSLFSNRKKFLRAVKEESQLRRIQSESLVELHGSEDLQYFCLSSAKPQVSEEWRLKKANSSTLTPRF